ncbi:hypothetical protein EW146_g593 [Bondarzewia mesenterica]|uniref:Nuclear protein DGCR14 n=1 Tax=Bondarzewia mesenterica TaxID=1095465 RepID=A0A4S4M7W5_9AGAM|nr:hypothetical protein EW146_g593 [Bondarzewia mesenterica]
MSTDDRLTTTSTSARPSTPPPPRSLNRQVVLEEDEYTAALSHIIARDFFPSLVHLDATNSYLDALSTQDPHLITASVLRLEALSTPAPSARGRPWQTPSETPYGGGPSDTPLRAEDDGGPPTKRAKFDAGLSLDAFQARYTSEDNSSFTQILDGENQRRRERYGWAWDAQRRVEAQRDRMVEGRERLLIEGPEAAARPGVRERIRIEAPQPKGLIAGPEGEDGGNRDGEAGRTEKNLQVVVKGKGKEEEEEGMVDVLAPKKDTRPAGVDGWKFRARNAFMFSPDADVSPYDPSTSLVRSNAEPDPRVIKHSNTRLLEQEEGSSTASRGLSVPLSPTRSRIDAAIAGTPYRPRSPGINNFSYVPAMPSPTPSELGPAAVKQLMTLGTLMGTPRVLSQTDEPAEMPPPSMPFHIRAPTAREVLSRKLSSSAAKSMSAKANLLGSTRGPWASSTGKKKGDMGPPTWTPRRAEAVGALTPAGKRLLDRSTMGTAAARRADAMVKMASWEGTGKATTKDLNKVRWTPTPSPVTRRGG